MGPPGGPRYGFGINPHSVTESVAAVVEGESLGYDRVGLWDSPARHREVWVTLTAAVMQSSRIRVGTWVTNPLTRHPLVTAAAAATLDDLAPGRIVLGIGTGDSGVSNLGQRPATRAALGDYVRAVRDLFSTGAATWQNQSLTLPWAARRDIPIWLAAHGPKTLRLAGEIADGVIVATGVDPDSVRVARGALAEGAAAAGRDPADVEAWWMAPWYVDIDGDRARRTALWHMSSLVHHWARDANRAGASAVIPDRYRAEVLELGAHYDLVGHGVADEAQKRSYAHRATELGVADYLLSRFAFSGTPRDVATQVRAAITAGATHFDCANSAEPGEVMNRPRSWHQHGIPELVATHSVSA